MGGVPVAAEPETPEISVPLDIILHMANYLNFADYRSFVRSIWPDGYVPHSVLVKLRNLSTHKFQATFLNGKPIDITYNFDPESMEEDRVLIDMNCLRPIFGGKLPPTRHHFASVFVFHEFVRDEIQLNECSDYRYAACPCFHDDDEEYLEVFVKPVVDECENKHFHHYCWMHIMSWLYNYLYIAILLRESKELFNQAIAETYAAFPKEIPYFQTGKRANPEFLLKTAHGINIAIYEGEDIFTFHQNRNDTPDG